MRYIHTLFLSLLMFASQAFAGPVDINSADAETLASAITGIGARKAALIVQYRDTHGPFASVDELTQVKGIGPATIEKNRENLMVNAPSR